MQTVYRLTAAVENIMVMLNLEETESVSERSESRKFLWIIEMLTACRQQEIYTRKILADVELCANDVRNLINQLHARLLKIHNTVRFRTAIPTLQVFVRFLHNKFNFFFLLLIFIYLFIYDFNSFFFSHSLLILLTSG